MCDGVSAIAFSKLLYDMDLCALLVMAGLLMQFWSLRLWINWSNLPLVVLCNYSPMPNTPHNHCPS